MRITLKACNNWKRANNCESNPKEQSLNYKEYEQWKSNITLH